MGNHYKDINTVCNCNKLFNAKTLHPLVSIINLSGKYEEEEIKLNTYSVLIQEHPLLGSGGRKLYDFNAATIFFRSPDKTINIAGEKDCLQSGKLLIFDTDLLCGTTLGKQIKNYTFFKYKPENESLHVSAAELKTIYDCIDNINRELRWGIDKFSSTIISNKIELLLNYCCRFYERQFITRHDAFDETYNTIRNEIDDYMLNGKIHKMGMPCTCCFSRKLNLSSAYINDLIKHESGKDFASYLQIRRIDIAKQMIIENKKSDAYIALALGFGGIANFTKLFMQITGMTTEEYRR